MEENKQHENSAILVFDCHFLMKTLLENKTYCKDSGGSKTERVIIKSSIPLFQGWANFGNCSQEMCKCGFLQISVMVWRRNSKYD